MLTGTEIKTLLEIHQSNQQKQNMIIISDIERDPDDELALITAAGLQKLGLIEIRGIVTNLKPAFKRAQLMQGALDILDLNNVPVGVGTEINETYSVQPYEFGADYMSSREDFIDGQTLLKNIFESSNDNELILLLISGLTDANLFIKNNLELATKKLKKVIIMGGIVTENDIVKYNAQGKFLPDQSYNHKVDMPSAESLYELLQNANISISVVSRFCAMACAISPTFYNKLAEEDSPIGKRLRDKQADSIQHLWERIFLSQDDPKREGLPPHCDKKWFLETFTANLPEYNNLTVDDRVWDYVIKANAYDPLALLYAVLPSLFNSEKLIHNNIEHNVVGLSMAKPGVIDVENVKNILLSLAQFGIGKVTLDHIRQINQDKVSPFNKEITFPGSILPNSMFTQPIMSLDQLPKNSFEEEEVQKDSPCSLKRS